MRWPGRLRAAATAAAAVAVAAALPAAADERTISIGGAITEIVYALGAGDRLIARDTTSRWPEAARALPDVGYIRRLSAEPILALRPDLILYESDSGPASAIAQLRAAGAGMAEMPDKPTPDGVADKIAAVAAALGLEAEGRALSARVAGEFAALREGLAGAGRRPRVLFLLSAGQGAPRAAGAGTSADNIIALAGGANALDGFTGYKPLSPEAAAAADPDMLLATERTVRNIGGREALLASPAVAATRATREGRLAVMDGLLLLGFGPRAPEAARRLATMLHPDLFGEIGAAAGAEPPR